MKISNQLLSVFVSLVLLGVPRVEAAPVSSEPTIVPPVQSELAHKSGLGGSIPHVRHWAPGKRAISPSFSRPAAGLEHFIQSDEGLWAAVPPLSAPATSEQRILESAGSPSCDAESDCSSVGYEVDAIEPANAVLAVAGFTPGILPGLLGSLISKSESPMVPDMRLPKPDEVGAFLRNLIVLAALLAIAGGIGLFGRWVVQIARAKRQRARPFRRYKVTAEQAIRGFVSPAMSPD